MFLTVPRPPTCIYVVRILFFSRLHSALLINAQRFSQMPSLLWFMPGVDVFETLQAVSFAGCGLSAFLLYCACRVHPPVSLPCVFPATASSTRTRVCVWTRAGSAHTSTRRGVESSGSAPPGAHQQATVFWSHHLSSLAWRCSPNARPRGRGADVPMAPPAAAAPPRCGERRRSTVATA